MAPTEPIHVYALPHRASEKQALVGAGRTQFAKPWRHELHINDRPFPHSVLTHELAHVMAAPRGQRPVPRHHAASGVWPLMGVIEGFAVAADDPVQGELTLHEWAAGMRRQKLAPDMRKLMGPRASTRRRPRARTRWRARFLRYLADTYGAEKLRALYAHGDFHAGVRPPLDELVTEWEQYVDALPLDEAAVSRAFARFRTGSLFTRACAREVARLSRRPPAGARQRPRGRAGALPRAAELQPEEPAFRIGEAVALSQLERTRTRTPCSPRWRAAS